MDTKLKELSRILDTDHFVVVICDQCQCEYGVLYCSLSVVSVWCALLLVISGQCMVCFAVGCLWSVYGVLCC